MLISIKAHIDTHSLSVKSASLGQHTSFALCVCVCVCVCVCCSQRLTSLVSCRPAFNKALNSGPTEGLSKNTNAS